MSRLLYACITWTLAKPMEKKLDWNNRKMLPAVLNKSSCSTPQNSCCTATCLPSQNHPNDTNKTCKPLLKKQRQTKDWHFSMDSCSWICLCWPTSKDVHEICVDTECSLEDLAAVMDDRDGWWEKESQRTLCCQHNLIMMIYIYIYI